MKEYRRIGLIGLVTAVIINLVALLVFTKSSAAFFSEQWWSAWFPSYIVWLVFITIGFASHEGKDLGGKQ